jgi:hypothetical protein
MSEISEGLTKHFGHKGGKNGKLSTAFWNLAPPELEALMFPRK